MCSIYYVLFVDVEIIKSAFIFSLGDVRERSEIHLILGGKKRWNESFQVAKQIYYFLRADFRIERGDLLKSMKNVPDCPGCYFAYWFNNLLFQ